MSAKANQRWITAIVAETGKRLPPLPWERAAKRARRQIRACIQNTPGQAYQAALNKSSNAHASFMA